jgi:hypothetical protein
MNFEQLFAFLDPTQFKKGLGQISALEPLCPYYQIFDLVIKAYFGSSSKQNVCFFFVFVRAFKKKKKNTFVQSFT